MQRRPGLGVAQCTHGADHRFRLEHHARAAAERHVVDLSVRALGVRAQVVHRQLDVAGGDRSPDHADAERAQTSSQRW